MNYIGHVFGKHMWCIIVAMLLKMKNFLKTPVVMILIDLYDYSVIASLFKCNFSYSWAAHTHTHTHNRFTALWTLSGTTRVSQYQKKHYAVFWIFWCKMKITQADTPTIQMDCHPIQTNWCPHLCHPTIFTPDGLPGTISMFTVRYLCEP